MTPEAAIAAMRWQSIDTAPRDGARVLIYGRILGIQISSWIGAPHNQWRNATGHNISHWMPLPEPPAHDA